mmetsp:Transcript_87423/g.187535  ORF Transcript_87423/g.187535 Transcript_87423/m.187535 type:complete len:168 (-) Transcript_87423:35-538(-)
MSSWQQAFAEDIRKGKKKSCPVVMNRNQEKNLKTGREDPDCPDWICAKCNKANPGTHYRCEDCQQLRPEERAIRLEMRAKDGEIGRGGGYFQRSSDADHRDWNSDDEEIDDFGRKKKKAASASRLAAPSDTKVSMSDKQKAALARLHQKGRGGGRASRSRSPPSRRR